MMLMLIIFFLRKNKTKQDEAEISSPGRTNPKSPVAGEHTSPRSAIREKVIPPDASPAFPGISLRVLEPVDAEPSSGQSATVVVPTAVNASASGIASSSSAPKGGVSLVKRQSNPSGWRSKLSNTEEDASTAAGSGAASSPPFPGIPVHEVHEVPRGGARRVGLSMSVDTAFPGIPMHLVGQSSPPPFSQSSSNSTAAAAATAAAVASAAGNSSFSTPAPAHTPAHAQPSPAPAAAAQNANVPFTTSASALSPTKKE